MFQKAIRIPNCALCKWSCTNSYAQMLMHNTSCGAQGCKDTKKVYNNKLCKRLYQQEETNEQ